MIPIKKAMIWSVAAALSMSQAAPVTFADDSKDPAGDSDKPAAQVESREEKAGAGAKGDKPGPRPLKHHRLIEVPGPRGGHIVLEVPDTPDAEEVVRMIEAQLQQQGLPEAPPSKHALGVMVRPLGEEARRVLPVEDNVGVVVQEVLEEGPASKAGLEPNDVVTHLDGKVIETPASLMEAVDAVGEKEVEIAYLRKGEKRTAKITPLLREKVVSEADRKPADNADRDAKVGPDGRPVDEALKAWRDHARREGRFPPGFSMTHMGPGFVAGPPASAEQVEKLQKSIDKLSEQVETLRKEVETLRGASK